MAFVAEPVFTSSVMTMEGPVMEEVIIMKRRSRPDLPFSVTSAFSAPQDRFLNEKSASSVCESSGMLQFATASSIRRGMALPMVAPLVPGTGIVVQPGSLTMVQVVPVKSFEHMHAHWPLESMTLLPPFWQGVDCAHWAVIFEGSSALRGSIMRAMGMTITRAARKMRMVTREMKPQSGSPQHRRCRLCGRGGMRCEY